MIIIENQQVRSDVEGMLIRRKDNGAVGIAMTTLPSDTVDSFLEIPPGTITPPHMINYEERVDELIRERYTLSQELSILRQRYTKTDEFNNYNEFAEQCKATARKEQSETFIV